MPARRQKPAQAGEGGNPVITHSYTGGCYLNLRGSLSVKRGEKITKENQYSLLNDI